MATRLPFKVGDVESIDDYLCQMWALERTFEERPLAVGDLFTLSLVKPPHSSGPDIGRARSPPDLPYGEPCDYVLARPLQIGVQFTSQVWVATPAASSSPRREIVLKFIIPSLSALPTHELVEEDIVYGLYTYPSEIADNQAAAYRNMSDFQGSTMLYFLGLHQVPMKWGEEASVLALEYLPVPNLRDISHAMRSETSSTRYKSLANYIILAESAFKTVLAATGRDIIHGAMRAEDILIDECNDFTVIIDWDNVQRPSDEQTRRSGRIMDLIEIAWCFLYYGGDYEASLEVYLKETHFSIYRSACHYKCSEEEYKRDYVPLGSLAP